MGALQRYIFRSAAGAFLVSLLGVTAVVWMTQSLRQFDLIATKGQSFWTFFTITLLAVPYFALLVAPLALFAAVVFVLNKLNTDSELAAINAAGVPPLTVLRPLFVLTLIVSLAVGALSVSAIPGTLRMARDMITQIRADIVVKVLREGEFTGLDKGLTLHIRARDAGAALLGILIEDGREPDEDIVYTAERGQVIKTEESTFLVLEKGAMQRKATGSDDVSIVLFDRYAFDLSPLTSKNIEVSYKPKERYISELWRPNSKNARVLGNIRSELHDRLVAPLYPIAFLCIAFAALGRPHTVRQSRFKSIIAAVLLIFALRLAGLGIVNMMKSQAWAVPLLYALLIGSSTVALAIGLGIKPWFRRRLVRRHPVPA
jgi:lipopolysaccharide export system permease protein